MEYYNHYKLHFSNKSFLHALLVAALLFSASLILNYLASTYATKEASGSVTDIILSNTSVHNVDEIFVYGTYALFFLILYLIFSKLNTLPFVIEAIALFFIIRSIFMSLTHIGPFPTQMSINSDLLSKINFGGDLFFSGHTGLPFLMALIFWHVPRVRYLFLCFSAALGAVVLMGHLHYTIDVVSAFFITYGIFHIARFLFRSEHELFSNGILK